MQMLFAIAHIVFQQPTQEHAYAVGTVVHRSAGFQCKDKCIHTQYERAQLFGLIRKLLKQHTINGK